jgi:excisionase family DNA binding protein
VKYITVKEAALVWAASEPRVRQWLQAGRIKGARKLGRDWLIPAKAQRPAPAKPWSTSRSIVRAA